VRKRLKLSLSMHEILQILSLTLFEKIPLAKLLSRTATAPPNLQPHNQLNLID
jgi:hypothetical protein